MAWYDDERGRMTSDVSVTTSTTSKSRAHKSLPCVLQAPSLCFSPLLKCGKSTLLSPTGSLMAPSVRVNLNIGRQSKKLKHH